MAPGIKQLFISLGVLFAGHGLSQTFVPVYASRMGWSEGNIGVIGSAYFLGFVIGCLTVPKLLSRAGHIRVFMTMTGMTSASILLLSDLQHIAAWIGLRFLGGWCLAAIYTAAESWINENAENGQRGRLISIYVLVSLVGMASGQVLFSLIQLEHLFALAALLILFALVPIGLFCDDQPMALKEKTIRMRSLRKVSLLARAGMFVSGVVTGSIWAMTPLLIEGSQFDMSCSGIIMMAVILGGAAFQLPAGIAADRFGRLRVTKIVVFSCLVISICPCFTAWCSTVVISMVGLFVPFNKIFELAFIMFLLGGTSLSLYTLASAEANDRSELSRVEIATALLLMNGLGSVIGPLLTGLVMSWIPLGLFLISGTAMTVLLVTSYIYGLMGTQEGTFESAEDRLADVIPIEEYIEETEDFGNIGLEREELVG